MKKTLIAASALTLIAGVAFADVEGNIQQPLNKSPAAKATQQKAVRLAQNAQAKKAAKQAQQKAKKQAKSITG